MDNKQGYTDPDPFGIITEQLVSKCEECIERLKSVETKISDLKEKREEIFDVIKSVNVIIEKQEIASRTFFEEIEDGVAQIKASKYLLGKRNQKELIRTLRSETKLKITNICEAEREQDKLMRRVEGLFKEWLAINKEIDYLNNVRENEYNNLIKIDDRLYNLRNDSGVKW
jgi:malate synthase